MTSDRATEIDELFATPPEGFVQRRNALVKELKADDQREAAERIAALKRPTAALWAINQLPRRHPDDVERYLDTQRSLGAMSGASDLGKLSEQRRRLVGRLTKLAAGILEEAGQTASTQTVQKIGSILLAVDTDEERDLLRRGRLERELTATGFGALALDPDAEPDSDVEETERADDRAETLEAEAAAAAAVAERLSEEAARLLQEADAVASEAREARKRAEELARDAKAARTKLNRRA